MGNHLLKNPIAFIDLKAQQDRIGDEIKRAIEAVLSHGRYIMGPEVAELERRLAEFSGADHVVTCGSGTEALLLPLMAREVGAGDAVFVPSFTFAATAEVVSLLGAMPVFVDVTPDTFNIDAASLEAAISVAQHSGLNPKAVIPVDLFGLPADYASILEVSNKHKLFVLEDAAQGFGAEYQGTPLGRLGDAGAISFFPAKPLGCYGDGGAIITDNPDLADRMRSLRAHGQGSHKYETVHVGINGRMDTLQAAILIEKLKIFKDEIAMRNRVADRYNRALGYIVQIPHIPEGTKSVWAQYTLVVEDRELLSSKLEQNGIPTAVYYPKPLHLQPAYCGCLRSSNALPVSEMLSTQVISLPMHPYLDVDTQDYIINAVICAVR